MSNPRQVPVAPRVALFLSCIGLIGCGVAMMIRADWGVPPNDVMNTGLADHLDIGVGFASWLTALVAMALAASLGRRPRVTTFVGGAVIGLAITAALAVVPDVDSAAAKTVLLVVGLGIIWVGVTGVVATDVGAGALELIMLALVDRRVGIRVARWGIEAVLLAIGLLLGGEVGVGTVLFVVGTGPVLAVTLPPTAARLGTSLHRRDEPAPSTVNR